MQCACGLCCGVGACLSALLHGIRFKCSTVLSSGGWQDPELHSAQCSGPAVTRFVESPIHDKPPCACVTLLGACARVVCGDWMQKCGKLLLGSCNMQGSVLGRDSAVWQQRQSMIAHVPPGQPSFRASCNIHPHNCRPIGASRCTG